MRRAGNLWPELTSFANILAAAEAAAAGKRQRPDVAAFLLNLEPNLVRLRRELLDQSYRPGQYHTFTIDEPKPRQISAAPFRDRVVHHALTRILEPVFEKRFSSFSFACRQGKGVHKALKVAQRAIRLYPYLLKCDIRKYFASIDHQMLNRKLAEAVKCKATLQLAGTIIAGSNEQEDVVRYFVGDDLFTPFERRRGLPLGNQTSQFFANVYLDRLDHFIGGKLYPRAYARYVDDLILFGGDKTELHRMRAAIAAELGLMRLTLHENKSRVYTSDEGVTFLGWRLFPSHTRLERSNVVRFGRRMRARQRDWAGGRVDWEPVRQGVQAWVGHASFGETQVLRGRVLGQFAFAANDGRPSAGAAGR